MIALNGLGTSCEGLVSFPHACNQFCLERILRAIVKKPEEKAARLET
jgi:hypothetical protein